MFFVQTIPAAIGFLPYISDYKLKFDMFYRFVFRRQRRLNHEADAEPPTITALPSAGSERCIPTPAALIYLQTRNASETVGLCCQL